MKIGIINRMGAVLSLLITLGLTPNAAAQSSERILFNSLQSTTGSPKHRIVTPAQICSMNSDGSDVMPLTSGNSDAASPSWSPDRTAVSFVRDGMLQVMDAIGEA